MDQHLPSPLTKVLSTSNTAPAVPIPSPCVVLWFPGCRRRMNLSGCTDWQAHMLLRLVPKRQETHRKSYAQLPLFPLACYSLIMQLWLHQRHFWILGTLNRPCKRPFWSILLTSASTLDWNLYGITFSEVPQKHAKTKSEESITSQTKVARGKARHFEVNRNCFAAENKNPKLSHRVQVSHWLVLVG